jgi:ATP synthase protein I
MTSDASLKIRLLPTSIVAGACLVISALISGRSGLFGASLASITVIIFFIIHLLVARLAEKLDPMTTMALAMFSYFAKVLLMGAFLLLVTRYTDRDSVDRASFAICAILITMTWLIGEIRSFLKLRVLLPLPEKRERD